MKNIFIACIIFTTQCLSLPSIAQSLNIATFEFTKPFEPMILNVLSQAGYNTQITYLPQARLTYELEDKFDGGYFLTEEGIDKVPGLVKIPIALKNAYLVAATMDPNLNINHIDDLHRYKIGIIRGSKIAERFAEPFENVQAVKDEITLLKMLSARRFQIAIIVDAILYKRAAEMSLGDVHVLTPILEEIDVFFTLTQRGIHAKEKITAAFRNAVDNGNWHQNAVKALQATPLMRTYPNANIEIQTEN